MSLAQTLKRQGRRSSPHLRKLVSSGHDYVLCAYSPHSWWHELGRGKMVKRLEAKGFPSLFGWLFVTLTIDQDLFETPLEAFEKGRDRIRRMMNRLKSLGYDWKRYFVKFELQQNGWPHWHLGVDLRGHLNNEELCEVWGYGWTKVKRIKKQRDFRYLFKYVTKDPEGTGELPDWILDYEKTIRVFQTSVGFYGEPSESSGESEEAGEKKERKTLRGKFHEWRRRAVIRGRAMGYFGEAVYLKNTFTEVFIEQAENGHRLLNMYQMPITQEDILKYVKQHGTEQHKERECETGCYLDNYGRIQAVATGLAA